MRKYVVRTDLTVTIAAKPGENEDQALQRIQDFLIDAALETNDIDVAFEYLYVEEVVS